MTDFPGARRSSASTLPLISILIPTRQRLELLAESVRSLLDRAARTDDIEIVCRTDRDDPSYGAHGEGIRCLHTLWAQHIGDPLGYRGLHTYYNECAALSRGRWLMIWNDDCLMKTADWDYDLRRRDPDVRWMVLGHGHFPVVSRRWFDAAKRITASPHADSFLTEIAGRVMKAEPEAIESLSREGVDGWSIHHRADELADAGSERRKAEVLGPQGTSAMFFKPEMQIQIERDAAAVLASYRMLRESR